MSEQPAEQPQYPEPPAPQSNYDNLLAQMTRQVIHLSSELAALKTQTQAQAARSQRLPNQVKVPAPQPFSGENDGDSVMNFTKGMQNYFNLVGLEDGVQQARFASILLHDKAQTWFSTQQYDLGRLRWSDLKRDLLKHFRPADYARVARVQLLNTKQTGPNVAGYIAAFNKAYLRCEDVNETEAKFLFEHGLRPDIALQVLQQSCATLAEAQQAAQRAGTVLLHAAQHGYTVPLHQNPRTRQQASHPDSSISGSRQTGPIPMQLGQVRAKANVQCFNCGKFGHYKADCWAPGGGAFNPNRQSRGAGFTQRGGRGQSRGRGDFSGSRGGFSGSGAGPGRGAAPGRFGRLQALQAELQDLIQEMEGSSEPQPQQENC